MPPVTRVKPYAANIDFTGTELTVLMKPDPDISAPNPLPGNIHTARSNGVPTLVRTDPGGGTATIRLIVTACDWEINRESNPRVMILRARYRIHDGDRAVKPPLSGTAPTYAVSMNAGLILASGNLIENDSINNLAVTNDSLVNSEGWVDIDQQGYSEASGHKTLYVRLPPVGNDNSLNPFSPATPLASLARAKAIISNQTSHSFPSDQPNRVLFARGQSFGGGRRSISRSKLRVRAGPSGSGSALTSPSQA